jgi:hypothetical protein
MMRIGCVIAVVLAGLSILTGCGGGPSDPQRTVTGLLVRVGGPAPGSPVPLPGTVVARNAAGQQFTATTGKDGRFRLSLPLGTYRMTGHSPQVKSDGQQMICAAVRKVRLSHHAAPHSIRVICNIS